MRHIRPRVAAALVALAGAVTSLLVAPSPAQAAKSDCPTNRLCVWVDPDFTGHMRAVQFPNTNWHEVAPDIADKDSSWYNRKGQPAHIFHDVSCEGNYLSLYSGEAYTSSWWYDDEGSSNIFGVDTQRC
jgi:hypothetical protein